MERGPAELAAEADAVLPIIEAVHALWARGEASAADLTGAYILAACAWRRPRAWLTGRRKDGPIIAKNAEELPPLLELNLVPVLLEAMGGEDFLLKRLGPGKLTVFRIFNEGTLGALKKNTGDYINLCMSMWCAGKRPCVLLFRVPSPMEVLRQQAAGERVVTLFLTRDELSRRHSSQLVYMEGGQSHSKDPLEFTLHDLKHMEHFVNPETHLEQVGFFKAMLGLGAPGGGAGPRAFFRSACQLDEKLWHELEYVISDMNTCISHLMSYMLAKLLFAAERKLAAACAAEDASNTCMHGCRCGAILACSAADAARPGTAAASACPSESGVGGGSEGGGAGGGAHRNAQKLQPLAPSASANPHIDPHVKACAPYELEDLWDTLLTAFGMEEEGLAWKAAQGMLSAVFRRRQPLEQAEGEALRAWFRARALTEP